jgi:uncharacterized protein
LAVANGRSGVFVDTSGWYALTDRADGNHLAAARRFRRLVQRHRRIVTTNQVIAESFTLTQSRLGPRLARDLLLRLRRSTMIDRVFVDEAYEQLADELLARYDDQRFSYADATSFVVMRRLGIYEALTFDHDFVIAGFALLADE